MVEASMPDIHARAHDFQLTAMTTRSFHDVLASLASEIDGAGMKVLHQIDPQQALAGIGVTTGGSRLLFFFHPSLVARVVRADPAAMVEAPLKLVVMEGADGIVSLRMTDPAMAFARYGNADLTRFGTELATTCRGIFDASV